MLSGNSQFSMSKNPSSSGWWGRWETAASCCSCVC